MTKFEDDDLQLPPNYLEAASKGLPPTLFVSGDNNNVFPESNKTCFEELKKK